MPKKRVRKQEKRRLGEVLVSVEGATLEVAAQYSSSPWLAAILAQKLEWHTLFAESMDAASSIAERTIHPNLFNAYVILGSRWFSHHEAIEHLLPTGRYGDCMVLLRSLLEVTDVMTYFACYPEETTDWMVRLSREPNRGDEVYSRGIKEFRLSRIWKRLKAKGIEPVGERDYSILSTTVHASPWGAQFYGRTLPGSSGRVHLSLAPTYDPAASFAAGLMLQGTYPRPIAAFLECCAVANVSKSQWRSIKASYEALIDNWHTKMNFDSWFRSEMADVGARILQGEEPEEVRQYLRERFEERYGKVPDVADIDTSADDVEYE